MAAVAMRVTLGNKYLRIQVNLEVKRLTRVLNKPAIRVIEGSLALFFFYLAVTKLVDAHEIVRLTTIGVSPTRRVVTALLQMAVGMLLIVGASGYVTAPMVLVVAVTEVILFRRPPLVAAMCVGAHGLTTWARHLHERSERHTRAQFAIGDEVATRAIVE